MAKNAPTYRWFGMILYPDCDDHMKVLEYIKSNQFLFPSLLYIRHLPEDYLEKMDPDLKVDDVDLGAEDILPRTSNKAHYHVAFKVRRAISEDAALAMFTVKDENGKRSSLVSLTPHLKNPEGYFTYMLHWDIDSILKNKHRYDISEIHGDASIIGKLGIHNTNFVSKGMIYILRWIYLNPGASYMKFTLWLESLHNRDPSVWLECSSAFKENTYWIKTIISDWKFEAKDSDVDLDEIFDHYEITAEKAAEIFERKI